MQRLIGSALFTLIASTLIAPSAHAVRPELLPTPQLNQNIERVQPSQTQPKTAVMSMQAKKMKAKAATGSDNPSPEYFEQLYRDRYGL